MLLGDLLARFDDDVIAEEAVLALGDLTWLGRLRAQAELIGQPLGDYARSAVRRFAAEANDEEWVTLLGALARAEDPGAVCLKRALAHSLQAAPA